MKQCIICGEDCSNRARVKDADGRYACKSCAENATRQRADAKPAPRPAARPVPAPVATPDDNDIDLSALASVETTATMTESVPCRCCGRGVPDGTETCPFCDGNARTGKAAKSDAPKKPKPSGPRFQMPALPFDVDINGSSLAVAALVGFGALLGLAQLSPIFYGIMGIALIVYALIFTACVIVIPFRDDQTTWGIINIVSSITGFGGILVLWYVLMVTERPWLKYMAGVMLLATVSLVILGKDAIDKMAKEPSQSAPEPAGNP
ncbi:MAG: hypothetical protein K2Y21_10795 [Phycisphaerales bacterium]|nr:hypothetical protein [Phycisphaerales bacterium]